MERLAKYILYFVIYGVLGMVAETLFRLFSKGEWSYYAGFLHLPLLSIYGFGALIAIWVKDTFKNPLIFVLLSTLFIIILEFIAHWLIELIFGIRIWDYSGQFFNFEGRISLFYSACFAVGAIVLAYFIHPGVEKLVRKLPRRLIQITAICSVAVLLIDLVVTIVQRLS